MYIHRNICKAIGVEELEKLYEHKPEPVYNNVYKYNHVGYSVITNHTILANHPDIVLHK